MMICSLICSPCEQDRHEACGFEWCDCPECDNRTLWQGPWRFWEAVAEWCAAAYRSMGPSAEERERDIQELRDELHWLRRVERGDYGDDEQ